MITFQNDPFSPLQMRFPSSGFRFARPTLMSIAALLLCFFAFAAWGPVSVAAQQCPYDTDEPTCKSCSEKRSFIDTTTMPRIDFNGGNPGSNLAYYNLLECQNGSCEYGGPDSASAATTKNAEKTDGARYFQGLVLYMFFGLFLFLLAFFFFIFIFAFRYFCCCVGDGNGLACCCGRAPTIKNLEEYRDTGDTSCCCGCFGYIRDADSQQGFAYPKWEVWFSRVLAWVVVAMLSGFIIAIGVAGIDGLDKSASTTANSASAFAALPINFVPDVNTYLSASLSPQLEGLANGFDTVTRAVVDIPRISSSIDQMIANINEVTDPTAYTGALVQWRDANTAAAPFFATLLDAPTRALQTMRDAMPDAVNGVAQFNALFYGTNAAGQVIPPLTNYVALTESSAAATSSFDPLKASTNPAIDHRAAAQSTLSSNDPALNLAANRLSTELAFETLTPLVNDPVTASGAPPSRASVETALTALKAAEQRANAFVSMDHSAWQWFTSSALRDQIAAVDNALAAMTGSSAWPPTSWSAYQNLFTSSLSDSLTTGVRTALGLYSTNPTFAAATDAAQTALAGLSASIDDLADVPLIGEDMARFRAIAGDLSDDTTFLIKSAENFTSQVIVFKIDLSSAQDAINQLQSAFDVFDTYVADEADRADLVVDAINSLKLGTSSSAYGTFKTATPASVPTIDDDIAAVNPHNSASDPFKSAVETVASTGNFQTLVSTARGSLAALNAAATSIANALAPLQSALTTASALQTSLATLTAQFDVGLSAASYCSYDRNIRCSSNSDCAGSNTCLSPPACFTSQTAASGPCSIAGVCSASGATCGYIASPASAFTDASTLYSSTARDYRTDFAAQAPLFDPSEPLFSDSEWNEAQNNLNQVTNALAPLSGPAASLDSARNAVSLVGDLNIPTLMVALPATRTALNTVGSDDIMQQVDAVDESLENTRRDAVDTLEDFGALIDTYETCLPQFTATISQDKVLEIVQTQGLGAGVDYMISAVDTLSTCFDSSQSLVTLNFQFKDKLKDVVTAANRIDDVPAQQAGPIYYLMHLANAKQVPYTYPRQGRIEFDADNNYYPGNLRCYTKLCVDNEVHNFNTATIANIHPDAPNIKMTYKELIGLTLIFPCLVVITLFFASVIACCRPTHCCGSTSTQCANVSLFFMFISLIIGTLLFSSVLWPGLLGIGDSCHSLDSLGQKYMAEGSVCSDASGTGPNTACFIDLTGRNNITVDLPATFSALATRYCDESSSALVDVWGQVRKEVSSIPQSYIVDAMDDPNDEYMSKVGPALRPVLINFADASSGSLGDLTTSAESHMGCNRMSFAYDTVSNSLCCDVFGALYWVIAGWYLMVWVMLICGIPAGFLGRKRFNPFLWGPMVERHQMQLLNDPLGSAKHSQDPGYADDNEDLFASANSRPGGAAAGAAGAGAAAGAGYGDDGFGPALVMVDPQDDAAGHDQALEMGTLGGTAGAGAVEGQYYGDADAAEEAAAADSEMDVPPAPPAEEEDYDLPAAPTPEMPAAAPAADSGFGHQYADDDDAGQAYYAPPAAATAAAPHYEEEMPPPAPDGYEHAGYGASSSGAVDAYGQQQQYGGYEQDYDEAEAEDAVPLGRGYDDY